jgi:hypothetical protein
MNFAFFQMKLKNKHQEQRYINSRFYEKLKKMKPKYKKLYKGERLIIIRFHPQGLDFWKKVINHSVKNFKKSS